MVLPSNNKHLLRILYLILPYLPLKDKLTICSLDRTVHAVLTPVVWNQPTFNDGYLHDERYLINKFLKLLPYFSKCVLNSIKIIDISEIEETLYDRVDPNFFRLIIKHCTQLKTLNMNKVTYFSPNSMIKGTWKLPHLTHINLSDCEFVNDDMIVTIARSCPKLMTVRLNNLKQHKGRGLAALASECDSLSSISICNNINVGDEGVVSLAKFRHIRLRELDLTGCTRITPVGFDFMARYLAHLTFLSLAKTSCRLEQLMKFTCIYRTLQSLDISGCQKMDPKEIANWIWHQKFSQLVDLTLDFSVASRLVKIAENTLVDTRLDGDVIAVRKLVNLTVCELPEKTSLCFLTQLVEQFPRAQVIKLKRGHFESDFLLGYYRTPSPENDYITSTSVNQFNMGQEKVIAIMENVNENRETSFDSW